MRNIREIYVKWTAWKTHTHTHIYIYIYIYVYIYMRPFMSSHKLNLACHLSHVNKCVPKWTCNMLTDHNINQKIIFNRYSLLFDWSSHLIAYWNWSLPKYSKMIQQQINYISMYINVYLFDIKTTQNTLWICAFQYRWLHYNEIDNINNLFPGNPWPILVTEIIQSNINLWWSYAIASTYNCGL